MKRDDLRNIAIIAHVDHGKTTLLDKMLADSGTFEAHEEIVERVMDSNPLERERGITILAKNTSLTYKDTRINIVDTPGHADFGGEVERILNMVDSVLLLVDAYEGPMPQTRFVLRKALALGLCPIVVINKIDRAEARPDEVHDMVFDLFVELEANEEQLEFTHIFASAKEGFAIRELTDPKENLIPLLDLILEKTPPADVDLEHTFQMLVTDMHYDNYLGRLLLGRITRGTVKSGARISRMLPDGSIVMEKIGKLFWFEGLQRAEIQEARAGDIVLIAGITEGAIGETLADAENPEALPVIKVDEPTISMNFRVNDSPFAGKEGKFVTSRHLRARLEKEVMTNISLRVDDTDSMDEFKVSGRGELHLSILIETMRRESYEFSVSRANVVFKDIDGVHSEPIEDLTLEVPEESLGSVMEELGLRKANVKNIENFSESSVRVSAEVPTRGLIGFRSLLLTLTRGEGIMNHSLLGYEPFKGKTVTRNNGVMVAMKQGEAVPYGIWKLQDRGSFIITPGTAVYEGMIVGEHSRDNDLVINPCTQKQLSNVRASGKDEAVRITPHLNLSLEKALEFIEDDELVEVTPESIRLRKRHLTETARKQYDKRKKQG
ncbi:MAG: GTP-binding protein [bacterium]|jgi:GTP-binding protein